ncbi:MAG TPA: Asp-tRNA(Asn)/Glu-tRNA(Gln) amidotransferase subunit GatA [Candidatus Copromonas faecavium]|uniref:Glutamyl-tRNA(Gln) amidotransferase subunit A n=1 Tax=Candidatus Copromonas faecavium (nom. illeg.) TaxID=2840740 RepID=A0A9D1A2F9_9FIRM|nr:Asp-tRNA(Asn)/Glu-tRNA(Gln) amidotransferase subunit GatA [Candidatus Copromonas faecavium]
MDILEFSATELAEKIRKREIGAVEAAKASLDQMEKEEKRIHAYLYWDRKAVLEQAENEDRDIRKGKIKSLLAGVPVAIKDNICTKEIPTTCASKILENFVPFYDAAAVRKLKEAGMVLLGKTNMDEFAMGSTTETSAFAVTRNPWNLSHVPGGSSGGSCAAVAAGEGFLALGSDTGGSIRQPASYCGVTGIKPTYGTVSRYGLVAYASSLDQIGPIGRTAADCALLLSILSGKDRRDATSLERKDLDFSGTVDAGVRGLKIGIPEEYLNGADEDVKEAVHQAAVWLERQGAAVETFHLKLTEYTIPAYYIIASAEASSNLERFDGVKYGYRAREYEGLHDMYKKSRSEGFGPEVRRRILLGSFVLSSGYYDAYYLKAMKARALIRQEFSRAFGRYDVLLGPASPTAAPKTGTSLTDPLNMYLSDIDTVAVNLAGLPGMTVPCTVGRNGLPIGVQLIGDCFCEGKLFAAAAAMERERGEWKLPFLAGSRKKEKEAAE